MNNTILLFFFYIMLLTISSCGPKEIEFNKSKWNERFDGFYLHREEIIGDLMSNHLRKGMSYKELTDLLGQPENHSNLDDNNIEYGIMEDYGWNIDPVETKTLRIELTKDSLVNNYEIIHWKN